MTYEQTSTDGNVYLYDPDDLFDYSEEDLELISDPIEFDHELYEKYAEMMDEENR